ncbi:hypothetical protein Ahy_B06g085327 [Arachis hypogaea]|uniref:Uncharacterized protein n=1 Tax=Arachis hypogaea TaxID=3818 RepID=A0A444YU67_ARAHY|nr:hypothetical protein Ahy_B06g085327 [Arachis hypogaea]
MVCHFFSETLKRQRTIQQMELDDLLKQGAGQRNPHFKAGNHNRHWGYEGRKSKYLEEVAARIEAAKKNLREKRDGGAEKRNARAAILIFYNYQLVINIRQRTIQQMELDDLLKQGAGQRNPHFKAGNHNRHWGYEGRVYPEPGVGGRK